MARLVPALAATLGLFLVLSLTGCNKPKKEADYQDPYANYNDPYDNGSASRPPTTDPYASTTPPAGTGSTWQPETFAPETGVMSATGQRTHMVAKGDTLFSLARKYYSDPARWRDIYNANRDKISDPNVIKMGQKLIIP